MRGIAVPSTKCGLRAAPRRALAPQCCFMGGRSLALSTKCPYRVLGVDYDADEEAIKVAFRRKAKQLHPDVSGARGSLEFMECQNAYQMLLDSEKRAQYDKTLLPRANSQVLSYLNARSAARHGVPITRVPSRAPYMDRPELYSTMLELLEQVKSCAKHLEREITSSKDNVRRGLQPQAVARAVPPCAGGKQVVVDCELGEQECCEPWIYYAAQGSVEDPSASRRRG